MIRNVAPTSVIDHLKLKTLGLVQELLDNTFIFYYDAQLGVNGITFEPLLAGKNPFFILKYFL